MNKKLIAAAATLAIAISFTGSLPVAHAYSAGCQEEKDMMIARPDWSGGRQLYADCLNAEGASSVVPAYVQPDQSYQRDRREPGNSSNCAGFGTYCP
jgi:hypothetical protein